ncbi:MAG TPA: cellulase family glycosylhydrolase [Tepidisphaeraceae bacterium]|jgi:hypothetical protein|nr:cellulase family glycosylhydrolase [Tepidisphaeraceae bacterium]
MFRRILIVFLLLAAPAAQAADPPISLHPDNPHYLLFRGKPTVLITSTEHYGAVLNGDFNYIPYLDELQAKKLNLTRTFSGVYRELPGTFSITDNTLAPKTKDKFICPWARSDQGGASDGGNKFDLSKFDPAYFERLKNFISEAGKRGVVVELVLFCTTYDDKLWAASPQNAINNINGLGKMNRTDLYTLKDKEMVDIHDALVRKFANELKDFDNLYYEICNEPYFAGVADDWQAHIAATLTAAEKGFPARHLIAHNIANGAKKIDKPDPNVSIFNFHYATPPDTVEQNYKLNKVLSDDETGFRGKEDVHYRTEAWEFVIAGGAIYDNLDYSFTPTHPDGTLTDFKSPGGGGADLRNQLRILHEFMDDLDFIHMKPMNGIIKGGAATAPLSGAPARSGVTVRALGQEGKAYAIYIRGGTQAELQLKLPNGKYHAEWLNTRTGKPDKSEDIEGGADLRLASPPYTEDIALRIKSAG